MARGLGGFQETGHHLPWSGGFLQLGRDSGTAAQSTVTKLGQDQRHSARPRSDSFHFALCSRGSSCGICLSVGYFPTSGHTTYEKRVLATRQLICEFHVLHPGEAALWMMCLWFKPAPVHRRCWCWFRWRRPPVPPAERPVGQAVVPGQCSQQNSSQSGKVL